jgi:UDPglucose--hexose-1-phosphate uridylyltransferase
MTISDLQEFSHRRYNPLIGGWVQVSPHRGKRPWQGQLEKAVEEIRLSYDPSCYLCPGNKRSGGFHNPDYAAPYSFVNDFSALIERQQQNGTLDEGLLLAKAERGICKVVCFSPRHDVTLPEMTIEQISGVVSLWIKEFRECGCKPFINYVQIFENKGAIMGCSNPHPHGQIWAQQSVSVEPAKKQRWQEKYFNKKGATLLFDYILQEKKAKNRVVTENNHFMVLVPFWAVWPYETMIVPKRAMAHIDEMTHEEQMQFASTLKELTTRYDNLFEVSFPCSAGIHQAPTDGLPHPEWHWYMVFYPPLLRSAIIKKFMVGYKMLANPQRDIMPEVSAEQLQSVSTVHFKEKNKAWVH